MTDPLDRQRHVRLRVLQALAIADAAPDVDGAAHGASDWMGERAIYSHLAGDWQLAPTIVDVREAVRYLEDQACVDVVRGPNDPERRGWIAARLTPFGRRWLATPGEHGLAIYSPDELPAARPGQGGRVGAVDALPPEVRAWLDQELVRLGFRDYRGLARELKGQGWQVSKSAVHRYGQALQEQIETRTRKAKEKAELAKALSGVYGDNLADMVTGAQGIALSAVMDAIDAREYSADRETLGSLAKAIPQIGRGLFGAAAEKRAEAARRKALEDAAQAVERSEVARGLTKDRVAELRRIITGIAA
jgi:hypothetical protein